MENKCNWCQFGENNYQFYKNEDGLIKDGLFYCFKHVKQIQKEKNEKWDNLYVCSDCFCRHPITL
jgi:hypothetical protein